jgi:hypothetical protein
MDNWEFWFPIKHFRILKHIEMRDFRADSGKLHWLDDGIYYEHRDGQTEKTKLEPQFLQAWYELGRIMEIR